MTRIVLGLSAWCKNKRSFIGESCEEQEGAFSAAKPFVVVAKAIVNKKKRNRSIPYQKTEGKTFPIELIRKIYNVRLIYN